MSDVIQKFLPGLSMRIKSPLSLFSGKGSPTFLYGGSVLYMS